MASYFSGYSNLNGSGHLSDLDQETLWLQSIWTPAPLPTFVPPISSDFTLQSDQFEPLQASGTASIPLSYPPPISSAGFYVPAYFAPLAATQCPEPNLCDHLSSSNPLTSHVYAQPQPSPFQSQTYTTAHALPPRDITFGMTHYVGYLMSDAFVKCPPSNGESVQLEFYTGASRVNEPEAVSRQCSILDPYDATVIKEVYLGDGIETESAQVPYAGSSLSPTGSASYAPGLAEPDTSGTPSVLVVLARGRPSELEQAWLYLDFANTSCLGRHANDLSG